MRQAFMVYSQRRDRLRNIQGGLLQIRAIKKEGQQKVAGTFHNHLYNRQ